MNQLEFLNVFTSSTSRQRDKNQSSHLQASLNFGNPSRGHQHSGLVRGNWHGFSPTPTQSRAHKLIVELQHMIQRQKGVIQSKRAYAAESQGSLSTSLEKLTTVQKAAERCQDQLDIFNEAKVQVECEFQKLHSRFTAMNTRRLDLAERMAFLARNADTVLQRVTDKALEPLEERFALDEQLHSSDSILLEEENHKHFMEELSKKASYLDAEDVEIDTQLQKASDQYEETLKENINLEAKLEVQKGEVNQILAENEESKNELKELQKKFMVSQRECERLLSSKQAEVQEKEDQVRLLTKSESMKALIESIEKEAMDQRTKREKLCSLLSESAARNQISIDDLEQLQTTRNALKRELEFSEAKCKQSETKLNDLMRNVKELLVEKGQPHFVPTIKDLLGQNASTLQKLKQHIQDREATSALTSQKLKAARKELHQVNIDYENQRTEFHELSEKYSEEESKNQDIVMKIQDLRQKVTDRKAEAEKYRQDVEKAQTERRELESALDKLLEQQKQFLQEKQNNLELVEELKEQLKEMSKEHPEETNKDWSRTETEQSHARLEEEIRVLEKEIKIARKEVKKAEKAAKQLKAKRIGQMEESDPELIELDEKLMELNLELEHTRNQILDVEAQIASAQGGNQKPNSAKRRSSEKEKKKVQRAKKENTQATATQIAKKATALDGVAAKKGLPTADVKATALDGVAAKKGLPTADVTVVDLTEDDPQPQLARNRKASVDAKPDGRETAKNQDQQPPAVKIRGSFKKPLPLDPALGSENPAKYRRTYTRKKRNPAIPED